jgi:type VI secretion system protein ImpI
MALTLTIENFSQLPDGGPLVYRATDGRGLDLGRDTYLDWTLPDPNMFISGKHCEVRCLDGAYWLYDVSLNGTYLNGADHRLLEPYCLRHGDRLCIGQYIIAVSLDEAACAADPPAVSSGTVAPENIWDFDGDVDAPIDPRELRPVKPRAVAADFLDWAMDAPAPARDAPTSPEGYSPWPVEPDSGWLPPPPAAPEPPIPPAVPHPERPVWDLDQPAPVPDTPASARREAPVEDPRQTDWPAPSAEPIDLAGPPPPPAVPRPDRPARALDVPEPRAVPTAPAATEAGLGPDAAASHPHSAAAAGTVRPSNADFVARFAAAAGLPADSIATRDPGELGELLGGVMAIVVAEMWQLLEARRETKRMVRCSDPTMTKAENNNPLKFAPTPQDALRQMLGPPSRAYLAAGPALHQGFADLARHQIDTIAAMQGAIRMLIEDLDPREIERAHGGDRGLAAMLGARKAKLWDIYVERWRTKARSHDDGLFGAYMDYFSKCYDRNVAERT